MLTESAESQPRELWTQSSGWVLKKSFLQRFLRTLAPPSHRLQPMGTRRLEAELISRFLAGASATLRSPQRVLCETFSSVPGQWQALLIDHEEGLEDHPVQVSRGQGQWNPRLKSKPVWQLSKYRPPRLYSLPKMDGITATAYRQKCSSWNPQESTGPFTKLPLFKVQIAMAGHLFLPSVVISCLIQ